MASFSLLIWGMACWEHHDPLQRTKELLLHDPPKAARYLLDQSPEEQVYIITQLSEEIPEKVIPFCEFIDGDAQKRCMRITHRPHLWEKKTPKEKEAFDRKDDCVHPHLCLENKALNAIAQGNIEEGRKHCQAIQSQKWSEECLFHISEELLLSDRRQYATTIHICEELSLFRDNCIQHGVFKLASLLLSTTNYAEAKEQIAPFATIWMEHNPTEGPIRISQLWAQWYHRRYDTPNNYPENISPEIIHHYHSSLAFWGIRHAKNISGDLHEHIQNLKNHTLSLRKKPRGIEPAFSMWKEEPLSNGDVYLGFSTRLIDDDPDIDLLIATLEAIARLRPPQMDLLLPFREHPHPKVQKTAKRLLSFDVSQPENLRKPLSMNP